MKSASQNLLFTLKWGSLHNDKLGFDLIPHHSGLVHVDRFNNRSDMIAKRVYFIEHNEQFELTTELGTELFSIPDPIHVKSELKAIEYAQRFFDVSDVDQEQEAKSKFKRLIRQYHPDLQGDDASQKFIAVQKLWTALKRYKGWK